MKTVQCQEFFHKEIKYVAEEIHLKLHWISKAHKAELYTAGDVEGHEGHDKRHYLIDTARIFPPEWPNAEQCQNNVGLKHRGNVALYRLVRPEFLQKWKLLQKASLNADMWTNWSDLNKADKK
eukprot:TRINITY_DN445_c0_g1_i1.p1 TRINITY_DN445_c0_g1~~TRINITY_DN445_c0_g1_i1.p1  ORF type:complete len:123 (+),score=28.89 TRINITY_DN445_c0_g1_i1:351-719(+)